MIRPEDIAPLPGGADLAPPMERFTATSDYDNLYAALARKSLALVDALDRNPSLADVVDKIVRGFLVFCRQHNLEPEEVEVNGRMTPDGRICVAIDRL